MRSAVQVVGDVIATRAIAEGHLDPSAVLVLAVVDPGELDAAERVDLIQAWERAKAMVDGLQQRALAAVVAATEEVGLDGEAARHEVGAALRLARALAADRDWVRWTTDPGTRQVIDRGARTYRPSRRMKAYLAARDRVCGFPGCHRPAQGCDCDHIVTFRHHGQTIRVNLGPLCRSHHNAKTHGGWRLAYDPDTACKTWTSPLGRRYTKGTDPPLQ